MESNQPDQQPPNNANASDWRSKFPTQSRHRALIKIMEALTKKFPDQDQVNMLNQFAVKFERKVFASSSSQTDYARKISIKLLSLGNKSPNMTTTASGADPANSNLSPSASQHMQDQRNNQGQTVLMPSEINQPQTFQQTPAQKLNENTSTGKQNSTGLVNQTLSMQNIVDASQNEALNSVGKEAASNLFNSQKEVPVGQRVTPGHHPFQQQHSQQLVNQKQLQIPTSLVQSPVRQQQRNHLLQQNQMQFSQQGGNSTPNALLQQHTQSLLRQQQHPYQTLVRHQQQMTHQSVRSSKPQEQLQTSQPVQSLGLQTNTTDMHLQVKQNMSDMPQLHRGSNTQQNSNSNMQQQRQFTPQQTNLAQNYQQCFGRQGNVSGLQQNLVGGRSSNSDMHPNQQKLHMVHHWRDPVQQQIEQPGTSLLENQEQHSQPSQSHMMPQIKFGSAQMQQQLGMNHQIHDLQQKHPPSGSLMQSHNICDQQKPIYQSQGLLPETSSASTNLVSQAGYASPANWQEEIFKKITNLKEIYATDIYNLHQRLSIKINSLPQQSNKVQLEKLKEYKLKLKEILQYLLINKSNVTPGLEEKLPKVEKLILHMLNTHQKRRAEPVILPTQSIQQAQSPDNRLNSSLQPDNTQDPVVTDLNNTSLRHNSCLSLSGVSNLPVNMHGTQKHEPNVDVGQGSRLVSLQQGVVGSMQRSSTIASYQTNMNESFMRNGGNLFQPDMSNLPSISSVNQEQVKKLQTMPGQQLKHQLKHRHQMTQKEQSLHQRNEHQQQSRLLNVHQIPQHRQMENVSEVNDLQGFGVKPGAFSQHNVVVAAADKSSVHYHQLKSGAPFPASSPRLLQKSSPQADPQYMQPSVSKFGAPLQSTNSRFIVPSPSTTLVPSPKHGDFDQFASSVSPTTTTGKISVQQSAVSQAPMQSIPIETFGISASSFVAEPSNHKVVHGTSSASLTKSGITEEPIDRLINAVKSISNEALSASVNDIGYVVSMIDSIAGSAPGTGSRAAVGDNLAAMTKCRLQAKFFETQEKSKRNKMKRCISSKPMVVVSADGIVNDGLTQFVGLELSDSESTATSRAKRPRTGVNYSLLKEISEINQRLIDTMVNICEEDVNPCTATEVACEGGQGVIVKCSYNAVALSSDLKSQYGTPQLSSIQPLRLLVPSNYPNCSPVLLDKLPVDISNENGDLSLKTTSKFNIALRTLSQPMSLKDIARTWDFCAREAISEHAQARGGGSISSFYGSWESVIRD